MDWNALKNKLEKIKLEEIGENEKAIHLNNMQKGGIWYDAYKFNKIIIKFINEKIKNKKNLTDYYGWQVLDAANVLYVDLDFKNEHGEPDPKKSAKICGNCANKYIKKLKEQLTVKNIEILAILTFIPCTYDGNKMGAHIYIFTEKDISADERAKIIAPIKDSILDETPLKTMQCLLPFFRRAKDSRKYIYVPPLSEWDCEKIKILFNPTFYKENDGYDLPQLSFSLNDLPTTIFDDKEREFCKKFFELTKNETRKATDVKKQKYGKANAKILDFVASLENLNEKHVFWKLLANNETKLKRILKPIMDALFMFRLLESRGYYRMTSEDFGTSLAPVLVNLIKRTVAPGENTKRHTEESAKKHIEKWYEYNCKTFSPENYTYAKRLTDGTTPKRNLIEFLQVFLRLSGKEQIKWLNSPRLIDEEGKQIEFNDEQDENDAEQAAEKLKEATENNFTEGEYRRECLNLCTIKFKRILKNFCAFVDMIREGLTVEIMPKNINKITFIDALRKNVDYTSPEKFEEDTPFVKNLKLWSLFFLFSSFYERRNNLIAVRDTITSFIRLFVWSVKSSTDRNKNNEEQRYIYNIRQTASLMSFPYNQWVRDNNNELYKWIQLIYLEIIEPILTVSDKSEGLELLFNEHFATFGIFKKYDADTFKPTADASAIVRNIFSNYVKIISEKRPEYVHEDYPAESVYFPMRNGYLEWVKINGRFTGKYKFRTNNMDIIMNKYTNIYYDENYDINNSEYNTVLNCIKQIYPIEDERNYILSLVSSVLTGVQKDIFMIMFGTGADGKTTFINAVQAMLGSADTDNATTTENGKQITLRNVAGLSAVANVESILVESAKTSHDEGGKAEMADARLCSLQEPEQDKSGNITLNISKIKEITSGTTVNVRGIFQASRSVRLNPLIVLQTNQKPRVSETTDAARRRIILYEHRAKFITKDNARFKNTAYHYDADPLVAEELVKNPKMWEALFHILLPYAVEIMEKGLIPISKIPLPKSIIDATEDLFENNSTPLIQWLNEHIKQTDENEYGIIKYAELVEEIINENNREEPSRKFLTKSNRAHWLKEIETDVQSKFSGYIYKLRAEFIKRNGREFKITFNDNPHKRYTNTQKFKEDYLNTNGETAISNGRRFANSDDVYIVGFRLVL